MSRLSFYFIMLLAVACEKDRSVDEQNENLQPVTFKVSGFSSAVLPLKSAATKANAQASSNAGKTQNYVEGNLYFWSFNEETLEPDIAYQKSIEPEITHNGADDLTPYVGGYTFDKIPAGKAYTVKGASEVLIKMPIQGVDQITQFAFDTGSSDTGPKDFEIYYSTDGEEGYKPLAMINQFGKDGDGAPKNTYIYQLTERNIIASNLWFKLVPKAGNRREAGGDYNEKTGTWRFDNIRLIGMAPHSQTGSPINKLHYFLFHKDKPEIIETGAVGYEEASSLTLNLAKGRYSICFISNESTKDLLFPENPTISSFYVGNTFANAGASIFGYVGELEVTEGAAETPIVLQRLFSQVKLEFTDAVDLSVIKKVSISQQHDPFFFAPFNPQLTNPILDQSDLEVEADFNANKQLVFNQFMGMKATTVPVKYTVVLYGTAGEIRTFQVESTLKSNMQLVFRGNLLNQSNANGKFQISQRMDWDGEKDGGNF